MSAFTIFTAYGLKSDKTARCVNAEPGTYGHECGKPAAKIGSRPHEMGRFFACYCNDCAEHGSEAVKCTEWHEIP